MCPHLLQIELPLANIRPKPLHFQIFNLRTAAVDCVFIITKSPVILLLPDCQVFTPPSIYSKSQQLATVVRREGIMPTTSRKLLCVSPAGALKLLQRG